MNENRNSFKGSIGFVLAAAGSAVGLGNIWRFPYLAAKDGGGLFLVIYIVLALTFGFTLLTTEIAIGRKTKQSPLTAYSKLKSKWKPLGIIACIVPIMIFPYYVTIGGWVRSNRNSKNFGFIVVNDGTFFEPIQVVYGDGLENYEEVCKINVGAAVIVKGQLVPTPEAKQPFEIQAAEVTVEGASTPDYPLQKKRHTFEYLRTISHLRPRTNTFEAVFRVRSLCAYAIHKFFQERDFVYVHTPLITGSDCEGAGEMFQVTTLDLKDVPKKQDKTVDYTKDFFGKPTNLTVSGQLNGETYAMAFKNIYTFGPTFRAENSNTTRHAAEFWMIEPEIAFADLEDDMMLAESMLKYVINYVIEHAPEEMAFFNNFVDKGLLDRLENVVNNDFARVTYTEAIKILSKHNDKFDYKVSWGCDLQTEHERYLTEQIYKRPVFVTDYPKEIKAFYMKLNEDGKTVAAVDLSLIHI